MEARDIIIKPVLTEKTYATIERKVYTFVVAKSANKTQIKYAVEELFGVKVEKVNTANCRGKLKTMGRHQGFTPAYKKAVVKLTAASKEIEFFKSLS